MHCSTSYSQIEPSISSTGGLVINDDSVTVAVKDIKKANAIMIKSKYNDSIIVELEKLVAVYDIECTEYRNAYNGQVSVINEYNSKLNKVNKTNKHLKRNCVLVAIVGFVLGLII